MSGSTGPASMPPCLAPCQLFPEKQNTRRKQNYYSNMYIKCIQLSVAAECAQYKTIFRSPCKARYPFICQFSECCLDGTGSSTDEPCCVPKGCKPQCYCQYIIYLLILILSKPIAALRIVCSSEELRWGVWGGMYTIVFFKYLTSVLTWNIVIDLTYDYHHSARLQWATPSVCVHLFVSTENSEVHANVKLCTQNCHWITSTILISK